MTVTACIRKEKTKAKILLSGRLLEEAGFPAETLVTVSYENDSLMLRAHGIGMEIYRQIIGEVRKKKQKMIQVTQNQKGCAHLELKENWLGDYGFSIGDVIVASVQKHSIGIKRLTHAGLEPQGNQLMQNRILTIQALKTRAGRAYPHIYLKGLWLADIGFPIGGYVEVTYGKGTVVFQGYQEEKCYFSNHGKPRQIAIHSCKQTPGFGLKGHWLEQEGFHVGDKLLVQYEHGLIHVHRLEL